MSCTNLNALARFGALFCLLFGPAAACAGSHAGAPSTATRGGVTLIASRCVGAASCLLGQVVAAETASPLARAAVFLEGEFVDGGSMPVRILALTDAQGVFTVRDAPKGRYRLAVYKDARRIEVRGLDLGGPGTTVVPIRLAPS